MKLNVSTRVPTNVRTVLLTIGSTVFEVEVEKSTMPDVFLK
jgi:hypothetical protein